MTDEIAKQVEEFSKEWQNITMAYSDYARSVGLNYTSLQVLKYITSIENCTQKAICEMSFLPRQTVNTIITNFFKNGFLELRELPEDRRIKTIHLTDKGREYVDTFSPHIVQAEYAAMEGLTNEQRKTLIEGIRLYGQIFREKITKEK